MVMLVAMASAVTAGAAALEHRLLWGFVFERPSSILPSDCPGGWEASAFNVSGPTRIERLPDEFSEFLQRVSPREVSATDDARERWPTPQVCLVVRCGTATHWGRACLEPTPADDDRFRFVEALFSREGRLVRPASVWFSEVSGLEVIRLPFLVPMNGAVVAMLLLIASAIRASRLPRGS